MSDNPKCWACGKPMTESPPVGNCVGIRSYECECCRTAIAVGPPSNEEIEVARLRAENTALAERCQRAEEVITALNDQKCFEDNPESTEAEKVAAHREAMRATQAWWELAKPKEPT